MIDGRNRSGAQFDQYEPQALLSKMVQHFFGVTNDQMKSGGWVVGMATLNFGLPSRSGPG
jgi:hypothetical protein